MTAEATVSEGTVTSEGIGTCSECGTRFEGILTDWFCPECRTYDAESAFRQRTALGRMWHELLRRPLGLLAVIGFVVLFEFLLFVVVVYGT